VPCVRCGAATTDPWPSPETLATAYAGWYRPSGGRFGGPGDAWLRRSRATLARRLDRIAPAGPVLDVGTGDGALLDALRMRGREAIGLELKSTRPDVRAAVEHLPRPSAALARAAELLAPGGVLVVAVPNSTSVQARVFGDRWLALDLPRHLVHLPAAALLRRLSDLHLLVTRTSYLRGGQGAFGWLHGFVGWLPGVPDLYDAIRRPAARRKPLSRRQRTYMLVVAAAFAPLALAASVVEAALRRGGTLYVEARRD